MRLKIIYNLIFIAFSVLIAGLFWMQIIKGGFYYNLSQNNRIRLVPMEASRGNILDFTGRPLADTTVSYDLVIMPTEIKDKTDKANIFNALSSVTGISVQSLEAIYRKNYIGPFTDVVMIKNIDKNLALEIEQMNLSLPAVKVKPRSQRRYIYKEATAHILGYLGEINPDELNILKPYGYKRMDLIGKSGLEKSLDKYLKGEDGGMQLEVNNRGYRVGVLSLRTPKDGQDVRLTIDAKIQDCAYQLLKEKKGAVVVLNIPDGRVIAMVSCPSFDPHIFITSEGRQAVSEILTSRSVPLLNRAVQSQYPPGSIFKIVTSAAALATGKISESTVFNCPGYYMLGNRRFNCWEANGHGNMDLKSALQHSCNVFFFHCAERMDQEALVYYSRLFGLGRQSGIDLPDESGGFVPDKAWKRASLGENWYRGDTLNFSIGQGYLSTTPLQTALMVSVIANNGKLARPYIIESINNVKVSNPRIHNISISKKNIDIIKDGMNRTVELQGGTGVLARVEGMKVSGKTGTAQVAGHTSHAWFVGYAPSDNPKAAIVVFVENGGYGGETAGPIAGAIFKEMKKEGML